MAPLRCRRCSRPGRRLLLRRRFPRFSPGRCSRRPRRFRYRWRHADAHGDCCDDAGRGSGGVGGRRRCLRCPRWSPGRPRLRSHPRFAAAAHRRLPGLAVRRAVCALRAGRVVAARPALLLLLQRSELRRLVLAVRAYAPRGACGPRVGLARGAAGFRQLRPVHGVCVPRVVGAAGALRGADAPRELGAPHGAGVLRAACAPHHGHRANRGDGSAGVRCGARHCAAGAARRASSRLRLWPAVLSSRLRTVRPGI